MTVVVQRRTLPLAVWPDPDRRLWEAARNGAYVATLQPSTLKVIRLGYGRWLHELAAQGCLDPDLPPADRVTVAAVQTYTDRLRAAGNTKATIDGRLGQLAMALRILVPHRSATWLHPSRQPGAGKGHIRRTRTDEDRVASWPAIDQQFWRDGFQAGDVLTEPRHGLRLRPETVHTIVVVYGHWLAFLRGQAPIDPLSPPVSRITRETVVAYVQGLRHRQNNASIVTRLSMLRSALRIMQPEVDTRWITAPGGRSLASLLPFTRKPIRAFSSKVLYDWGQGLMRDALAEPNPEHRRMAYRDGLLIALFAARAPRVRSMASLQLGRTVLVQGKSYRLIFEADDVKTSRSIEYDAPAGLGGAITRYIAVERAELLDGQSHNAFWVDQYGQPMESLHLTGVVRKRSKERFGEAFGPHRFRHGIGTTAPLVDPAHPGVAAAVLGITGRMVERHYNRASQVDVASRWHASLGRQRADAQTLARNTFRKRQRN